MKLKNYNRICILDTETTDVYWNSAAPVQIAAFICDGAGNVLDQFNEKIKTTHQISPGASEVHGIYEKDLVNCRKESEVLNDFCAWIIGNGVDVILTYNGETFDRPMLKCRCEHLNIPVNLFNKNCFPGLDGKEAVMAARKANVFGLGALGKKWKLTLVAEKLGFDTSNAHDAFADIRMLKEVFFKLDPVMFPDRWEEEENI